MRIMLLLTKREHSVFHYLAQGATTSEIAKQLQVSESTVRTHVRHLHEKLVTSGRAQLVRAAVLHKERDMCTFRSREQIQDDSADQR